MFGWCGVDQSKPKPPRHPDVSILEPTRLCAYRDHES
jgi:hypothetical protein